LITTLICSNVYNDNMSNITSTQTPLWKHGTRGNNIEFANIKQLEKQESNTYRLMEWKEGFTVNDANYQYFVGKSQYGYWLSRKRLPVFILDTQAPLTIKIAAAEPKKIVIPDMKQLDNMEEAPQQPSMSGGADAAPQPPEYKAELSADEIYTLKQLVAMLMVISK
jgi:hypothetical protein